MFHRIQQLGIDSRQPRQRLRIQTIVFFAAFPDQPHLASIRHDHFVPQLAEQATDPGEWVPISSPIRLRGMAPNTSRKAFAVVRTRCSSCMWPASSNTQYQLLRSPRSNPIVNFCCTEKFLLCCVTAVLLFFITGLLYLLRFERVDNLGAYSMPSGDRPSHLI